MKGMEKDILLIIAVLIIALLIISFSIFFLFKIDLTAFAPH